MNEPAKQPTEKIEVIRDRVALPETQAKHEEGDRSPTKTERDLNVEAIAQADEENGEETDTLRKPIVPDA